MVSRGFTKLKDDFDLDDMTVSKDFLNLKTVSSETFIRSVQFEFLDDVIYTNVRLAKIGYVPKDTCTFCDVDSETVLHLFYECPFTNLLNFIFCSKMVEICGKIKKNYLRVCSCKMIRLRIYDSRSHQDYLLITRIIVQGTKRCIIHSRKGFVDFFDAQLILSRFFPKNNTLNFNFLNRKQNFIPKDGAHLIQRTFPQD